MTTAPENGNGHQGSTSFLDFVAQLVIGPVRATLHCTRRNWQVAVVVLAVAAIFGAGWCVRVVAAHASPQSIIDASPVGARAADVGVLDGVTITGTWTKTPPGSQNQEYVVSIEFAPPAGTECGGVCAMAMRYVLGSDSCDGQQCVAELKDVDEGGKVDSSDIYALCQNYQNSKQKVLIEFSGLRNQSDSQYPNMLLVVPSAQ